MPLIDTLVNTRHRSTVPSIELPLVNQAELRNPWLRQAGDAVIALARAQSALGKARSWRGFRVSACGITLADGTGTFSYIHGVNRKPQENGPINIHAEDTVLDTTAELGRGLLSVLAIVADIQPDDGSRLNTPTLTPCSNRCTPRLKASSHIDERTLILSAATDLKTVQCYDVQTLELAYQTDDPDLLPVISFETPNALDHQEWRQKLIAPLGQRALLLA
ncbi:MAG TPA: hypothetical protein VMR45_04540 [Patescibacteria group bacterium]|jgi:hypothetical protein|nr:hypothetical protein [Patescibacteria group bacterium]